MSSPSEKARKILRVIDDQRMKLVELMLGTPECQVPSRKNYSPTSGDCPVADNVAIADNTLAANAAPSEGSEQSECTLTDAEREAIESAIWDYSQNDDDEDCARMVATLGQLLERME